MTEEAQAVLRKALRLDIDDRALLAAELLASMDSEESDQVEKAWAEEIDSRVQSAKAGGVPFSSWEDVEDRLHKRYFCE